MKKKNRLSAFFSILLSLFLFLNFSAFAEGIEPFEEKKALTKEEESLLKYKFQKITVRHDAGKWIVFQGINSELTDIDLLKIVGLDDIANDRLKDMQFKQNVSSGLAIGGVLLALASVLFLTNVIKVDNGFIYGVSGLSGGIGLVFLGDRFSPLIIDESEHIISFPEALAISQEYNRKLKESLGISAYPD